MNKFVKIGDYLLPAEKTDNIHSIYDVGRIRRVYFKPIKYGHFIDTSQTLDELLEIFNTKEQPVDWIPCSERLPNSNGCYLVWRPHFWSSEIGMPAICYFDGQNTWHDSYGIDFERTLHPNDVIAWKPLPDPYKGEQE